jgi:hypothetical protein
MAEERYPGYRVLSQKGHWDETTRKIVLDRVHNVPGYKHFDSQQQRTLEALCERVMPQASKPQDRRIPIGPWIDQIFGQEVVEGYRFDDMPPVGIAWKWGLEGLDQTAQIVFGGSFAGLDGARQDRVLDSVRDGSALGEIWSRMPAARWWIYVAVRQITGVYYAHPFAWDEIGFGGPAFPRGYFALNFGAKEPWEVNEAPSGGED